MNNKFKNAPVYLIILASMIGWSLRNANPIYQLIFLGLMIIILIHEAVKMKREGEDINKVNFMIAVIMCIFLIALAIIGQNCSFISLGEGLVVIAIAFLELVLVGGIFGYKIVANSGDSRRIRQFLIGLIGLIILFILMGVVILLAKLNYL